MVTGVIRGRGQGVYGSMNARRMTKLVLGLGLVALGLAGRTGMAQEVSPQGSLQVGNKRYDAGKELARLTKRYGLSDEQKAKIQPILLEQQKQVHVLGEDTSLSDVAWNSGVRKVHLQTVAKVKRELTDVQASKYAKDEEKWTKSSLGDVGDDGDDGPPDGPPPGGPPGGGPGGGGPGGGPPGE